MTNNVEEIVFGYMINNRDFSIKPEMFENKQIQYYIKMLNDNNVKQSDKDKLQEFGNAAQTLYLGHLSINSDKSREMINQQLKDELKETYYQRIGLYERVFNSFFDDRLMDKITDEYIDTGFERFNFYLDGGLKKKTFTGIQCTTGGGKSTMLHSIGTNMLKLGFNIAFVNLEMNIQDYNNNILSGIMCGNDTELNYTYFRLKNFYNRENPEMISGVRDKLTNMNLGKHCIIINEDYQKIDCDKIEKLLLIEEERQGIKFDAVLIDYLFLLSSFTKGLKNEQNYDYLQRLSQEAHKMAQRNNWAIVSVFQTNRNGFDSENGKSSAVDIAGSFNAMHDMDNYFTFARENGTNNIVINPVKTRQYNGTEEKKPFKLHYNHDYKVYVETEDCQMKPTDYKWQDIWDCEDIHNNLNVNDFNELLESLGKKQVDKATISKQNKKKGYTHPKQSTVDWHELNLDLILNKKYGITSNTNNSATLGTSSFNDMMELFS